MYSNRIGPLDGTFKVMAGRLEKGRTGSKQATRRARDLYVKTFCSQVSQPNIDIEIPNVTEAEKDLAKERKIKRGFAFKIKTKY